MAKINAFLKHNSVLKDELWLRDASLVIDANHLAFDMYERLCEQHSSKRRNDIYGGDWVVYRTEVERFFNHLNECNISALLVRGASIGKSQDLASLENNRRERGFERFIHALSARESDPPSRIFISELMTQVFRDTANSLGVETILVPSKVDLHIVRLANERQSYVLSDKGEFWTHSLHKGLIPLNSFEYKNVLPSGGQSCIKCDLYSRELLRARMPQLAPETLPLLSILLKESKFNPLLKRIERTNQKKFVAGNWKQTRIAKTLCWLEGKMLEEAITAISMGCSVSKSTIRAELDNYDAESQLSTDLEPYLEEKYPAHKAQHDDVELMPSGYLSRRLSNGDLNNTVLSMIFKSPFYSCAIDDLSRPSSFQVRHRLFSVVAALLRPQRYSTLSKSERQWRMKEDSYDMYDRVGKDYTKVRLRPMESLDDYGSLDELDCYSMITLPPERKRALLMATFRLQEADLAAIRSALAPVFNEAFIEEAQTCCMMLVYNARDTEAAPESEFVDALLLTLLYYAAKDRGLSKQSDACQELVDRLESYENKGHSSSGHFRPTVHRINQLQVSYNTFCFINSLLEQPFPNTQPGKFFNSVMLYRLTVAFLSREAWNYMEELCGDLSEVLGASRSFNELVQVRSRCASNQSLELSS